MSATLRADYIVVGGGSAGAVVAARLSEAPDVRVLLLEAGPARNDLLIRMPAGVMRLIGDPELNWGRSAEPDATVGGRALDLPAGKVLGGSSAINGLVYTRGFRRDFAGWTQAGASGWSYEEVLPYFLRAEHFRGHTHAEHGRSGPLRISTGRLHPLARRFLDASAKEGMTEREDYCDGEDRGSFAMHGTIDKGRRVTTYTAYLKPALRRANLQIETGAVVEQIIFEGKTACGVRYKRSGAQFEAFAAAEVIVCGGTYGSPLLLQRSGVGPSDVLLHAGVQTLHHAPQLGANLQDHLANGISRLVDAPSFNEVAKPWHAAIAALQWAAFGAGPLASVSVQAMAYGRRDGMPGRAEFMLSFMPLCIEFASGKPALHRRNGVYIAANVCRPSLRGSVAITAPDVHAAPKITLPLLGRPDDVDIMLHALRVIERLFKVGYEGIIAREQDEPLPATDAQWQAWLRDRTSLGYHSVGTCRMGGADAVLDPQLRVRGLGRLRVADASVMPIIPSANTNAAAIMIGERAADLIRGR